MSSAPSWSSFKQPKILPRFPSSHSLRKPCRFSLSYPLVPPLCGESLIARLNRDEINPYCGLKSTSSCDELSLSFLGISHKRDISGSLFLTYLRLRPVRLTQRSTACIQSRPKTRVCFVCSIQFIFSVICRTSVMA